MVKWISQWSSEPLSRVRVLLGAPEKNKTNLEESSNSRFFLFFNNDWFGIKDNISSNKKFTTEIALSC